MLTPLFIGAYPFKTFTEIQVCSTFATFLKLCMMTH